MLRTEKVIGQAHFTARVAFTLVELLVVLAIISVLAAITAGATIQIIGVQRKTKTEQTIKTAAEILDKQWATVVAQASGERIPTPPDPVGIFISTLAGSDPLSATHAASSGSSCG